MEPVNHSRKVSRDLEAPLIHSSSCKITHRSANSSVLKPVALLTMLRFQDAKEIPKRRGTVLAVLFVVANWFYFLSLRGASDPTKLNHRLPRLGTYLAVSALASSVQLWLAYWPAWLPAKTRRKSSASQAFMLILWCSYDHGSELMYHGAYNLLVFTLIFVPVSALLFGLTGWAYLAGSFHHKTWRFPIQLLGVILVTVTAINVTIRQKGAIRERGFFGQTVSDVTLSDVSTSDCRWEPATPWFDLLPFRQNFFVGPMTCPPIDTFQASFSNGSLLIECDAASTLVQSWFGEKPRFPGAAYSLLPRTENWGLSLKNDSLESKAAGLQENVLRYIERHTFAYKGSTRLSDDTDTVLAWCGESDPKIVHRILPASGISATSPVRLTPEDGLNVIVIFIDAVSRAHFHHRLPRTVHAIEDLVGPASASARLFEFFRYSTVGLNTSPNTRALWAGLEKERPRSVAEAVSSTSNAPIWEQFQAAGYVAGRIDPDCQDWSAYYDPLHLSSGSQSNSTESMLQSAEYLPSGPRISHEQLAWSCLPPYYPLGVHFAGNFAGATSIKARCLSGTHVGWQTLDWADSFLEAYSGQEEDRKAFHLHASFMESHEGSGEVLASLDSRLASFLDPESSKIDYSNTAVVIVSDHGPLMGLNNAFFKSGKVEASNPFAAIILPREWTDAAAYLETQMSDARVVNRKEYTKVDTLDCPYQACDPDAELSRGDLLSEAQGRLVTGFDFYETIRGFMPRAKRENLQHKPLRGYDLAREFVPARSCRDAGVPEEFCRCK